MTIQALHMHMPRQRVEELLRLAGFAEAAAGGAVA
jgi:hypothetical protein